MRAIEERERIYRAHTFYSEDRIRRRPPTESNSSDRVRRNAPKQTHEVKVVDRVQASHTIRRLIKQTLSWVGWERFIFICSGLKKMGKKNRCKADVTVNWISWEGFTPSTNLKRRKQCSLGSQPPPSNSLLIFCF